MPWYCAKHPDAALEDAKEGKVGPKCPKCKNNTFVNFRKPKEYGILLKNGNGFNVHVESHQGKHTVMNWPGYSEGKGSQFKSTLVAPTKLALLLRLWDAVEAEVVGSTQKLANSYFECGQAIGTKGETYVTMQWVKEDAQTYCLHAYPEAQPLPDKQYVEIPYFNE
jgi:hypothetical protein